MAQRYTVKANAVKVAVGSNSKHRIAHILRAGDTVPEGVVDADLERLVSQGLIVAEAEEIDLPEGDPSEEWTGKQLDHYAQSKGIDLGGAKTKPEKVAAIAAAAN